MCSKRVVEDEYHFILECIIYNVSYRHSFLSKSQCQELKNNKKIIFNIDLNN